MTRSARVSGWRGRLARCEMSWSVTVLVCRRWILPLEMSGLRALGGQQALIMADCIINGRCTCAMATLWAPRVTSIVRRRCCAGSTCSLRFGTEDWPCSRDVIASLSTYIILPTISSSHPSANCLHLTHDLIEFQCVIDESRRVQGRLLARDRRYPCFWPRNNDCLCQVKRRSISHKSRSGCETSVFDIKF